MGNLKNTAVVIASLHKGEKRLVFCDSRAGAERLASLLRTHDVETHAWLQLHWCVVHMQLSLGTVLGTGRRDVAQMVRMLRRIALSPGVVWLHF